MTQIINPQKFTDVTTSLRTFFMEKRFVEVHTQNRLSILAACEDPTTVATYNYAGEVWPLPQTGQMWLEYELLKNPKEAGYFCVSTSYRQEPEIVKGRHDLIFPMFEFEFPGTIQDLKNMEIELCAYLGFDSPVIKDYKEWAREFGVTDLLHNHEGMMHQRYGTCMIENFPNETSPFWNMKQNGDGTAAKIDVILEGMETIGSAERSTDERELRNQFHEISDGVYASLLYGHFGKDRVMKELNEFLSLDFIPRVGGGIGLTRLISAIDSKTNPKLNTVTYDREDGYTIDYRKGVI